MGETFVLRNGRLVRKSAARRQSAFHVMPDIAAFTTQEGVAIGSRSQLRAYEQKNGVRQVGNDFATFHAALRAKVYGEQ
jgi:hypothetical protein